jgi:hypothetical protein
MASRVATAFRGRLHGSMGSLCLSVMYTLVDLSRE